jgi:membrane protease YdiL (CAAX protease family)
MFNRYWRDYPWFMQLMQFALMIFIFMGFTAVLLGYVIPNTMGISTDAVNTVSANSPMHVIHGVLLLQFTGSFLLILLPAFLFAYNTHPRPLQYLGLVKPKGSHLLWVTVMMLGIIPLILKIPEWLHQINFGSTAERVQADNDRLTSALLKMNNFGDFIMAFATMAILPAIGEEMMFRGVIMKMAAKRSRSMTMPVLVTAILFTWVHGNIYGMVSIFIAGVLLAVIYYATGSLWCSILAHLINNGLQIVVKYTAGDNVGMQKALDGTVPLSVVIGGLIVFGFASYMLWKNSTPLRRTWVNDFTNEELEAIANSENNNEEQD